MTRRCEASDLREEIDQVEDYGEGCRDEVAEKPVLGARGKGGQRVLGSEEHVLSDAVEGQALLERDAHVGRHLMRAGDALVEGQPEESAEWMH